MLTLNHHKAACIAAALALACFGAAEQNAEAEGHCKKFMTPPDTAPISPKANANRDLVVDAEAEKWYKQVLAGPYLPENIRGVIMEGFTHLWMEHSRRGLADRKADARQFQQDLVVMLPDSARFLIIAAAYAADDMGRPDEAITALRARLRDVARNTDAQKKVRSSSLKYLWHSQASALGYYVKDVDCDLE